MDGNGRWASNRGLPKIAGHREGANSLREVIKYCRRSGIQAVTVYAFSTENWKRPRAEVEALMALVGKYLNEELASLIENNICVHFIGRIGELPDVVRKAVAEARDKTSGCSAMLFNIALNYGSRSEIVDAVNDILKSGRSKVDEEVFGGYLYTRGEPDPDLLIRTSGESRVSNFLLWQISYAELYFTETLWPDFRAEDLKQALDEYGRRKRSFGGFRR